MGRKRNRKRKNTNQKHINNSNNGSNSQETGAGQKVGNNQKKEKSVTVEKSNNDTKASELKNDLNEATSAEENNIENEPALIQVIDNRKKWEIVLDSIYKIMAICSLIVAIIAVIISQQSASISRQALDASNKTADRTEQFEETQRYFQPFSGKLKKNTDKKMNVYMPAGNGNRIKIELDGIKVVPYQGGISDYTLVLMDNEDNIVVGKTLPRKDPNDLKEKVNEYDLPFGEMTFNRVADLDLKYNGKTGEYRYFDAFILLTDYSGEKYLYLVTLLTYYSVSGNNTDIDVVYYNIYGDNILLEKNSKLISVSEDDDEDDAEYDVVEVYDADYFKNKAQKNENVDAEEVYAYFLSNSIQRYQKLHESGMSIWN